MTREYTIEDARRFAATIEPMSDQIEAFADENKTTLDHLIMTTLITFGSRLQSVGVDGTVIITNALKTALYLGYEMHRREIPNPDIWFAKETDDGPGM